MLKPNDRDVEAIRKLAVASPNLFNALVEYLERCRDFERHEMEQCCKDDTEVFKGRCRMLSEGLMILRGLVPKRGIQYPDPM